MQIFIDLRIRKEHDDEAGYQSKLGHLRAQIDVIDNAIIETMGKRMKTADSIGAVEENQET